MKVLHITNNYPTESYPVFGVFVKEQIDSLKAIGIISEVFFINGREKGIIEYLRSISRLRGVLRSNRYDILHCHHALSAICLVLSTGKRNTKTILSYQNDPEHELGKLIYWLVRKRLKNVILKSKSTHLKDNNSYYLPNGVNMDLFKPIEKRKARELISLESDLIYVLFVSSNILRRQKRYDKFKTTLELLKNEYGYKNIRELKAVNIERREIPIYYNAADIHLLSSDFEGSPNSVKECMACNTPVVATDVGNVKELFNNAPGYHISEDGSPENLAFLIDKALNEKYCKGRERITMLKLDAISVAKKLENIYLNLE